MRWPKYLDRYPAPLIAQRADVKPATVKRWRRKGLIPDSQVEAVRSLHRGKTKVALPSARAMKKLLRDRTIEWFLDLYNEGRPKREHITRVQVKRWKKRGEIPVDHRAPLVDAKSRRRVRAKIGRRLIKRSRSKNWGLFNVTWEVNQPLTDGLIVSFLSFTEDLKTPKGAYLQFYVDVNVELLAEDTHGAATRYIPTSYRVGVPTQDVRTNIYCLAFTSLRKARNSLYQTLRNILERSPFVHNLGLIMRVRRG